VCWDVALPRRVSALLNLSVRWAISKLSCIVFYCIIVLAVAVGVSGYLPHDGCPVVQCLASGLQQADGTVQVCEFNIINYFLLFITNGANISAHVAVVSVHIAVELYRLHIYPIVRTVAAPVRFLWQGIDSSLVASVRAVKISYNFIITSFDCQGGGISVICTDMPWCGTTTV